jgi:hypothetical protein
MQIRILTTIITKEVAGELKNRGWAFDWYSVSPNARTSEPVKKALIIEDVIEGLVEYESMPDKENRYVHALQLEIDPLNSIRAGNTVRKYEDIAGMLLAFVAQEAFNIGYDGFIMFESKTAIIKLYVEKYGAKQIGSSQQLYFDTVASKNLVETYLKGKEITYV